MSAYVMQEMTWPEIRDALEEAKLAILPVGSQEQHGVVVNGHGGNQHVLDVVSVKMRRDLGIRMAYALWPVLGGGGGSNEKLKGRRIGHACIIETSMMMHLRPDLVREDKLAEGELQPPIYGEVDTRGIGGFVYWNEYTRNGAFEGAPDATQEIGENVTRTALERMIPFVRKFAEAEVDGNTGFATL